MRGKDAPFVTDAAVLAALAAVDAAAALTLPAAAVVAVGTD